jgi:hypothetical protein
MSNASAVVAAAEDAVREADAQTDGTTPPSAEVQARETTSPEVSNEGAKAAAKAVGAKPAKPAKDAKAKPAKPAAAEKPSKPAKYDDETKAACKRAQEIRTKKNAVAPVTVTRVVALLAKAKTKPEAVVGAFKSQKDAHAFAGGDKEVKMPDLVKTLGEKTTDPFARGRGLVSISLALAGK